MSKNTKNERLSLALKKNLKKRKKFQKKEGGRGRREEVKIVWLTAHSIAGTKV